MATQDNETEQRVATTLIVVLLVLVVGAVLGLGIASVGQPPRPTASSPSAGPGPARPVVPPAISSADASVVVDEGVVSFYFATGKADLAPGALGALADAIAAAQAGARLVISGYHDATGDPVFNEALARQRAVVVRDALRSAGVREDRLQLEKPTVSTGSGADAEARRVEVRVVP